MHMSKAAARERLRKRLLLSGVTDEELSHAALMSLLANLPEGDTGLTSDAALTIAVQEVRALRNNDSVSYPLPSNL